MNKRKSIFSILQNVSITLIFIVTAIFICSVTGLIHLTPFLIDTLGIIIILCLACIFSLPWIKYLEAKKHKISSIIFLSIIGICAILWIICLIILVYHVSNNKEASTGVIVLIKVSLLLSIQLIISSTFASIILKYKKSMLPLQIITFISYIFLDIYFSIIIICISSSINFDPIAGVLFSKVMLTLLVIAIVFVCISNIIIKRIDKKRITDISYSNNINSSTENNSENTNDVSATEKLQKLKELYEKELITKEEYENKKSEILKDF